MSVFEQVGELTRALVPSELGELRFRAHRRGVKVWFDGTKPPRFHYEAQVIPSHFTDATEDGVTLEVGFHAEHGDERVNKTIVESLQTAEKTWRKVLGPDATAGPFLGNSHWGRLSETWVEPDLDEPELAFELAARLADYVVTVHPLIIDSVSSVGGR